jgi:hypothetical protein
MALRTGTTTARRLRAVFFLGSAWLYCLFGHAADQGQPSASPVAPQTATQQPAAKNPPSKTAAVVKPTWAELTAEQQQALSPLAGEWDKLDSFRKKKWLEIGSRYAKMKPEEQQRMQERMREWVTLTPEQRRIARESYTRAKKLDPNKKQEHWQQYQQLPEEQKKKLAEVAASKKHVAALPSPAAQNKNPKPVPPIKSAPKPVIEQSVTPQATTVAPLQDPASPAVK